MRHKQHKFRLHPLSAAVAAALAMPGLAWAQPNLPGKGFEAAPTTLVVSGATLPSGTNLDVTISGSTAALTTGVVIQWGGTSASASTLGAIRSSDAAGFNIGSGDSVTFLNAVQKSGGGTPPTVNVLNVDATGNTSYIEGTLAYQGPGSLWVANANGIMVGSQATIDAPGGLGLIDAPVTGAGSYSQFVASGSIPINFANNLAANNTGLTVDMTQGAVGNFMMLIGANNVNVGSIDAVPSAAPRVVIDGGIAGNVTGLLAGTAHFTPDDQGVSASYMDVLSSVTLNLGATAPFNVVGPTASGAGAPLTAYVDGSLTNNGALTDVNNVAAVPQDTFRWINGTFTNNGSLTLASNNGTAVLGFGSQYFLPQQPSGYVYGNGTQPEGAGGFVNAGTLAEMAGVTSSLIFAGAAFANTGTISLNNGTVLNVLGYSAGINLGGVVGAATGTLKGVYLDAPDSTVTLNTDLTLTGTATVEAANFNLDSQIDAHKLSFEPAAAGQVVINGGVSASYADFGTKNVHNNTFSVSSDYLINGHISASHVSFGASSASQYGAAVADVTGAGSITTANLTFNNLTGSVNNIQTTDIGKNGFQVNGWPNNGDKVTISVTATGQGNQGFNLKVNGNPTLNSGNTQVLTPGGTPSIGTNTPDIFFVKATGNVAVDPTTFASSNYAYAINHGNLSWPAVVSGGNVGAGSAPGSAELFQWPGLIYIQSGTAGSGNQITVHGLIANAFSANAMTGRAGVFLLANTLDFTSYPTLTGKGGGAILTNGNAGVVMAQPFNGFDFGFANIIDGSGATALPPVYFWNAGTTPPSLVLRDSYYAVNNPTGEKNQELQTFLTLYPQMP